MIALIYSVKDKMTNKFHNPMFICDHEHVEEEATRIFKMQINENPLWRNNPEDFDLYMLGALDDESGTLKNEVKKIADGRSVIERSKDD